MRGPRGVPTFGRHECCHEGSEFEALGAVSAVGEGRDASAATAFGGGWWNWGVFLPEDPNRADSHLNTSSHLVGALFKK